jgi:hypothetical protein
MKHVYLLVVVSLLLAGFHFPINDTSIRSVTPDIPATVIVTNASDVVDGDVSSMEALNASPGPDGISLREAIDAANNTLGLKAINFSSTLMGATIFLDLAYGGFALTSGQLTINGDVNGDGRPDITLNDSLDTLGQIDSGFFIVSSDNIIQALALVEFSTGIRIICTDPNSQQKTFVGNQITENALSSTRISSIGISIGGTCSDTLIQDTLVDNNTTSVNSAGVFAIAGVGGPSNSQIINITIINNHIIGGTGIGIGGGDTSSDFWGDPPPIKYSDNNLVDHVVITGNVLEGGTISVGAANHGNRYNRVQHVQINNNTLTQGSEIVLSAAGNGGPERSTSDNVMSDIQVDHNTIVDPLSFGVMVSVGDGSTYFTDYPNAAGIENNQISGLQITNNTISDYGEAGIKIWGACGVKGSQFESNNRLDQVTISGNTITHQGIPVPYEPADGIAILAGDNFGSPVQGNVIQDASIFSNTISGNNNGILLIGGRGSGVQGNRIIIAGMPANILAGNTAEITIMDNTQGALGNFVDLPYKIYLPLIDRQ